MLVNFYELPMKRLVFSAEMPSIPPEKTNIIIEKNDKNYLYHIDSFTLKFKNDENLGEIFLVCKKIY